MPSNPEGKALLQRVQLGRGEVWALAAALGYALYQVFLGVAMQGEVNDQVGTTVQALPGLLFAVTMGWFINRRGKETTSPFSDWRLTGALLINGFLLFVVATPLLFAALRRGGVLITSPVSGTQVLFAAILAALLLREPFTRTMALGMVISVLGVLVLSAGRSGIELSPTWWLAVPYALGAGLCWSVAGVLLTYSMRRGVDPYQALAIPSMIGLLVLNVYLLITGQLGLYAQATVGVLASLLIAGVFTSAALVSLTLALNQTTVASATTLNSLQVAIAPLIAWIFLGETMNLMAVAGILLILGGVIIVQRTRVALQQDSTNGE